MFVRVAVSFLSGAPTDEGPMQVGFIPGLRLRMIAPMSFTPRASWTMAPWMAGVAVMAVGCDAQMTPDYQSDPIDSFRGMITSSLEHPVREAQVALVWVRDDQAVFDVVVDEVVLEGGATEVEIGLSHLPDESDFADCTLGGKRLAENQLGFGWIAVALQGVLPDGPVPLARLMELRRDGWILGFAANHVVAWVGDEMLPDTNSARILSGTFTPGPYLMEGSSALRLAPENKVVPIVLSDAEDGFRVPFFPWRECTDVAPPAEATQSLGVDVNMSPTQWGPST